jgi:predicted acyl esterase
MRTPYGRASDKYMGTFMSWARRGYIVVSQDCRGTGGSEPETWDYYVYESEDSYDLVEWVSRQSWFNGFLAGCGGSYVGQTQWCMARHPRTSTIVPEVSGLGIAINTTHLHMFLNAYARSVGKGSRKLALSYTELERQMLDETLSGGYFNEPLEPGFPESLTAQYPLLCNLPRARAQRWLWELYGNLSCAERAAFIKRALGVESISIVEVESLPKLFGQNISHDAHTLPHPNPVELIGSLHAPALMVTGWYDWGLNDALATWDLVIRAATDSVRARSRLIITPGSHNGPGYREGIAAHPELQRTYRTENLVSLLMSWYTAIQEGTTSSWPTVIYYMMGANEWRVSPEWPPGCARTVPLYLGPNGTLNAESPRETQAYDRYRYDPQDPTPTLGGSILSAVYSPGSVDVSNIQQRSDILTYTTPLLEHDLEIAGPIRLILYASSSAIDTDFSARLSDVFPDGRAIQLQSGILRTRYRNIEADPEPLQPGRIYRLEVDMWACANCFRSGHRLRLDIASADFPRFDRNTNVAGVGDEPVPALQTLYRDAEHPSHVLIPVLQQSRDTR